MKKSRQNLSISIHQYSRLFYLSIMILMILPLSVKSQFNTPSIDGKIKPGEYGTHVNGYNQQTAADGTVWYMAWDAENLYIGYSGARLNRGKTGVVYLNNSSLIYNDYPDFGSYLGPVFNSTQITFTSQRSDAIIYFSTGSVEIARSDGYNIWAANEDITGLVSYAEDGDRTRIGEYEIGIPWYMLDYSTPPIIPIPNPTSFSHVEYVVKSPDNVIGQLPSANSGGAVGLYSTWSYNNYIPDSNNSGYYPFGVTGSWYECSYNGTVTSQTTGLPISGASVQFISGHGESPYPSITNASGFYQRLLPSNVAIPNYFISVGAAGYEGVFTSIYDCGGTFNFQLQPQ